jgi:replicative DNA helicase
MHTAPYERSIISTLMYDISRFGAIAGMVTPEHFFDELCAEIFTLAQSAYYQKDVFSDLIAMDQIPGRDEEIYAISSELPVSPETLIVHADIIIKASNNRKLLKRIEEFKADVIAGKDVSIDSITQDMHISHSKHRTNTEIIKSLEARLSDPSKDHGTGLRDLDKFLNLEHGNMIIVAARPSMGKTGFVTSVIWHLLKHKEGSIFFSLEMSSEGIAMRMIANESGEEMSAIRHGRLRDYERYNETKKKMSKADKDLIVIDSPMTEIEIYNVAVNEIRKNPAIKNIFVDHLTYVSDSGGHKSKHLQIDAITKTMKRLAKDTGTKVWVLSQLSRAIESRPNRRPQLSDMRESGSIEEDADVIIGLYRDSYYATREDGGKEAPVNEIELIVLKNRDGEVGTAKSYFVGPNVKITDEPPYDGLAAEVVEYVPEDTIIEAPVI